MSTISRTLRENLPGRISASLIALAGAIALLYYGQAFLITLSVAVIIAFILDPFVGLLMRLRLPRSLASFVVCAISICVLYLVGLGLYTQAAGFSDDLPRYGERVGKIVNQVLAKAEVVERSVSDLVMPKRFRDQAPQPTPPPRVSRRPLAREPQPAVAAPGQVPEVRIRSEQPPLVGFIYSHLRPVYEWLLMASFIPFLVYFMLSWRAHIQRSFLQLFQGQGRVMASKSLDGIAAMVRAFVVGNFVLGLLMAVASTVAFWALRLPYPLLVGPISGFLSMVPYIGLPLALVPPLMAMLTVYSTLAPYILVFTVTAMLHLVAANLLYPKIVGPRVHLNPVVVTVALMFWSVLWGVPGLMLAIPLTAGIKAVCDNVGGLEPVGRLLGD
ncbi:MAG: AI-2E family transporter [Bryobacteraceae bacterium]